MIKLVCKKCGAVWYTANTEQNQKCDKCGHILQEDENKAACEENEKITNTNK